MLTEHGLQNDRITEPSWDLHIRVSNYDNSSDILPDTHNADPQNDTVGVLAHPGEQYCGDEGEDTEDEVQTSVLARAMHNPSAR